MHPKPPKIRMNHEAAHVADRTLESACIGRRQRRHRESACTGIDSERWIGPDTKRGGGVSKPVVPDLRSGPAGHGIELCAERAQLPLPGAPALGAMAFDRDPLIGPGATKSLDWHIAPATPGASLIHHGRSITLIQSLEIEYLLLQSFEPTPVFLEQSPDTAVGKLAGDFHGDGRRVRTVAHDGDRNRVPEQLESDSRVPSIVTANAVRVPNDLPGAEGAEGLTGSHGSGGRRLRGYERTLVPRRDHRMRAFPRRRQRELALGGDRLPARL